MSGRTPFQKSCITIESSQKKTDIADQFNKNFVNVGPNLAHKIGRCEGNPTQYIKSTPEDSFVLSCVTETQVCSLFKCLNDHESSLDIPNILIKIAAQPLSIPLIYLKPVYRNWYCSDILKVSQVSPVYKNGDAANPSNYRPHH